MNHEHPHIDSHWCTHQTCSHTRTESYLSWSLPDHLMHASRKEGRQEKTHICMNICVHNWNIRTIINLLTYTDILEPYQNFFFVFWSLLVACERGLYIHLYRNMYLKHDQSQEFSHKDSPYFMFVSPKKNPTSSNTTFFQDKVMCHIASRTETQHVVHVNFFFFGTGHHPPWLQVTVLLVAWCRKKEKEKSKTYYNTNQKEIKRIENVCNNVGEPGE